MNSPSTESLKSEIEYVKSMAEAGDKAKFSLGKFVFWGGLAVAGLYLAPLILFNSMSPLSKLQTRFIRQIVSEIVPIAPIIAFSIYAYINRHKFIGALENAAPSRAMRSIWFGIALSCVDLYLSLGFIASNNKLSVSANVEEAYAFGLMEGLALMFMPVLMSLIGVAWFVTAEMTKNNKLAKLALLIFICAPLTALIPFEKILLWFWVYMFEILFFIIVPAILFLRKPKVA